MTVALPGRRACAGALVTLTILAGLSGCGRSDATQTPQEAEAAVRGAYRTTVDALTAKVTVHADLTADVAGRTERAELTGEGGFNFGAKTSQMAIVNPLGLNIELRTAGVQFYEKAPIQLRKRFPGTRPWMRFDFEAADRAQYGNPLYVFAAGADDPWQLLGFLPAASSVEFVETQTVRGTETRHYRAVVTLADLAAIGDAQTRPGRQRFQEKVGLDRIPMRCGSTTRGGCVGYGLAWH